jgi:hypothetical protein
MEASRGGRRRSTPNGAGPGLDYSACWRLPDCRTGSNRRSGRRRILTARHSAQVFCSSPIIADRPGAPTLPGRPVYRVAPEPHWKLWLRPALCLGRVHRLRKAKVH